MEAHEHVNLDWLQENLLHYPELEEWLLPHLASCCESCAASLRDLKAQQARFHHWDASVVLVEGAHAAVLFDRLLSRGGGDFATLTHLVENEEDFQTWGLAVIVLETAQKSLSQRNPSEARSYAILASAIAHRLGQTYHPEWVKDLEAWAYTVAAAASVRLGEPDAVAYWIYFTQRALEEGTQEPGVRERLQELLGRLCDL